MRRTIPYLSNAYPVAYCTTKLHLSTAHRTANLPSLSTPRATAYGRTIAYLSTAHPIANA
eukprot:3941157-Rhodomonas_salina.1